MSNDILSIDQTFKEKDSDYQKKIAQCLIQDHKWAEKIFEIIHESYFTEKYLSVVVGIYFEYYRDYKVFPEIDTLIILLKDALNNHKGYAMLIRPIVDFLKNIKENPLKADAVIIKDSVFKFCKRNALSAKIVEMAKNLDKENFDAEKIVSEMQSAIQIGHKSEIGHIYKDELDKRAAVLKRTSIPTGTILDHKDVLNGGIEMGQIAVVMAPSGVGKSMILVALASNMLRLGLNVVFYTLEMSFSKIGVRFDANFSSIAQQDVYQSDDNKDLIRKKLEEDCKGDLIIAEYNSYELTAAKIRSHLNMLHNTIGFKPDCIIVDYADIMAPNEASNSKDAKSYDGQGSNYFTLRNLGKEYDCAVITAVQTNRSGATKDILDKTDISEDFKKVMNADIILGFTQEGILSVAKNRNGKSGHYYLASYDWSTVRLDIMQEADEDLMNLRDMHKKKYKDEVITKNLRNHFIKEKESNSTH
jgi:replicative DNA helicase